MSGGSQHVLRVVGGTDVVRWVTDALKAAGCTASVEWVEMKPVALTVPSAQGIPSLDAAMRALVDPT